MRVRKQIAITAFLLSSFVLMAGCSSSQDGDPEFTDAGSSASGPYSVNDCSTLGSPISAETAPPGLAIDGLVIGEDAVPTISVGPDSVPAVELVSQQLIAGSGASVALGDTISVNYCGVG